MYYWIGLFIFLQIVQNRYIFEENLQEIGRNIIHPIREMVTVFPFLCTFSVRILFTLATYLEEERYHWYGALLETLFCPSIIRFNVVYSFCDSLLIGTFYSPGASKGRLCCSSQSPGVFPSLSRQRPQVHPCAPAPSAWPAPGHYPDTPGGLVWSRTWTLLSLGSVPEAPHLLRCGAHQCQYHQSVGSGRTLASGAQEPCRLCKSPEAWRGEPLATSKKIVLDQGSKTGAILLLSFSSALYM